MCHDIKRGKIDPRYPQCPHIRPPAGNPRQALVTEVQMPLLARIPTGSNPLIVGSPS